MSEPQRPSGSPVDPQRDPADASPRKSRRAPRHIQAAARVLQKEARKILRKHGDRIAAAPADEIRATVAAIDTYRAEQRIDALEHEAEQLDELLHTHAAFARKSAWRETLENVGVAVLIALGLRSCLYEPFKIPSGSMMPTLRAGDHIFVNKFTYGIQIPFTTTIVGQSWGDIERGDVIVFRFPLDESEDFIKRVVGLPGDEVRVAGREVAVKRAGEDDFAVLPREPLDEPCRDDETGTRVVTGCQLFEETAGDKTYVVRYMSGYEGRTDLAPKPRVWKVPDDHLLVMGDNRNQSHDSLAWTVITEAVGADRLITQRDLRDLTDERLFTLRRPGQTQSVGDGKYDHIVYHANHRSRGHDLELGMWRDPALGDEAVFSALAATMATAETTTVAELLAGQGRPRGAARDRALEIGARIDALVVERNAEGYRALARLGPSKAILDLRCGQAVCKRRGQLVSRLVDVVANYLRNSEQDARALLERPTRLHYDTRWTGRGATHEYYVERLFYTGESPTPARSVRMQAFRKPDVGVEVVRDAALASVGSSTSSAKPLPAIGDDAWLFEHRDGFVVVDADSRSDVVAVLSCGRRRCATAARATALVKTVHERMAEAGEQRRALKRLLQPSDVPGWREAELESKPTHEYDRVHFKARARGDDHALELEVWLKPEAGLPAKLAELQRDLDLQPDDSVVTGGAAGETDDAWTFAFAVPESETVLRLSCRKGLCPKREQAIALARRAAEKALDPSNFIDPQAERPQPFVPRGHVKGRAERIWLPLSRFWLPIR